MSAASRPQPPDGFRITTLALALSPLVPIIPWQDASGAWSSISLAQSINLHLATDPWAYGGALLTVLPSALAAASSFVPGRKGDVRRRLAASAMGIATLGLPLVHLRPPMASWLGIDALIPGERFVRYAWMTFLLSALWVYMEWRHRMEEAS